MATLLAACGGGSGGGGASSAGNNPTGGGTGGTGNPSTDTGGNDAEDACGVESQKDFVEAVARDWYLWYGELATISKADYDSAQAYLSDLTAPLGRDGRDPGFSYLTTAQEDEARFTSGAFVGFGFRFDITPANQMYFADIFQGSPAGDAGLSRGNEVLAIDSGAGFETIDALAQRGATIEELFGPSELGVERGFRVLDAGTVREVVLKKRELSTAPFAVDPLLIEREGLTPVGYLNLRSFTTDAGDALPGAFETFREAGVEDLVIDLRYNGGGLLRVADEMLDLLGGLIADEEISFKIAHNDKRAEEYDEPFYFNATAQSVRPLRIAFITTGSTASASELVINGLSPFVEVVLIGEDTLGKAVGQYAFDQTDCDTRLRLVAFELVNGESQGGYYNGLAATGRYTLCPAADDITKPFGDPGEASLSAALGWLNASSCGAVSASGLNARSLAAPAWSVAAMPEMPFGQSRWLQ